MKRKSNKPDERIRQHYSPRVAPDRAAYDILDWSSAEAQNRRFAVLTPLLRQLNLPADRAISVLDVGCGMADLAVFLKTAGFTIDYTGVDITPAILAEARRRSPTLKLLLLDVLGTAAPFPDETFDLVYGSGIFNLELGNNELFVERSLPRLFQLSRYLTVVNFLHQRCLPQYPHCHYYDPKQLQQKMRRLGLEFQLQDDYLENDFSLIGRKTPADTTMEIGCFV